MSGFFRQWPLPRCAGPAECPLRANWDPLSSYPLNSRRVHHSRLRSVNGQVSKASAPVKSETPPLVTDSKIYRSLSGSLTACNRTSIGAFSCSTKTKREGRVSPTHSAEGPIVQVQRSDMSDRIILRHIERIVRSHQESVWPEDIE